MCDVSLPGEVMELVARICDETIFAGTKRSARWSKSLARGAFVPRRARMLETPPGWEETRMT